MADFPTQARVVIIGGGAVGVSCLYHLAKAGWTDCVLLEKNELTAGSTWHAAGNVPTFSSSWSLINMQRYSASLYRELGALVDYPMNYHVTGSVRLGQLFVMNGERDGFADPAETRAHFASSRRMLRSSRMISRARSICSAKSSS